MYFSEHYGCQNGALTGNIPTSDLWSGNVKGFCTTPVYGERCFWLAWFYRWSLIRRLLALKCYFFHSLCRSYCVKELYTRTVF